MSQFISGPNISKLTTVHEDERRAIREAVLTGHDGALRRMTVLSIKGVGVLGNHYHNSPEYFTVLDGDPTILTAPKEQPSNVAVHRFPEGGHITMAPGQVHTFQFERPGTLMSTMDGAFDPTDMHPQKLEPPTQHQR